MTPCLDGTQKEIKKIFIDPGHGGKDPGAAHNGLMEKDVVLDLAKRLRNRLKNYNCEIRLARDDDVYITNRERALLANNWQADLYYSIHCNAHGNTAANGYEDYIHPYSPASTERTQHTIHVRNASVWKQAGRTNRGMKQANFQVLRETSMSAILVEHGFLSNARDAELLKREDFRKKITEREARGIIEVMGLKKTSKKDHRLIFKGKEVEAKTIIDDGTMYMLIGPILVPVRKVAESLGLTVRWENDTRTAYID